MKKRFLSVFAIIFLAAFAVSCKGEKKNETKAGDAKAEKEVSATAVKYTVDNTKSVITWKGSKTLGKSHDGTFNTAKGTFAVKNGALESGNFIIDIASLKVVDIPVTDKDNAQLKGHLLSKDFFDAENHKNAVFSITNVSEKDGKTMVEGNLTLKNVKKNISFPATVSVNGNTATIKSEVFTINRLDFGMKYGSGTVIDKAKDNFINDDVELSVHVIATAK